MTRARRTTVGARAAVLALAALAGSCATRDPRVLSPADVAAGCSVTTPSPCEAACFRGGAAACAIFGAAVEGDAAPPVRLPQDRPRARKALERGCNLGNLDACRTLVDLDAEAAAPAQVCAGLEPLCGRGDRRSCAFLAECLDHVEGFRHDRPQAVRLLQDGCAQGERVACRELASFTLAGKGVPRDEAKAFSLVDQACRLDDPLACAHEGLMLERGVGVAPDLERAKVLYRGACRRGVRGPVACESLRRLGETPPSAVVTSADAKETSFVSAKLDYEWRLPANWELADPKSFELNDGATGLEVVAARPRVAASRDSVMLVVTDLASNDGGASGKAALDGFEAAATRWFLFHGVSKSGSARTKLFGLDAVRVDGQYGLPEPRSFVMALFVKDRRRFELRCLSEQAQPGIPCADAFAALSIHEPKPDAEGAPRVVHVREPRFGLTFDAPDDAWVAGSPKAGVGGNQLVWSWKNGPRRIELSAMNVASSPGAFETVVSTIMDTFRSSGATVSRTEGVLGDEPCAHLQIDKPGDAAADSFLQRRGDRMYIVVVSAPARDPDLLERVRAAVRIEAPEP